jgi:hypothetical protein
VKFSAFSILLKEKSNKYDDSESFESDFKNLATNRLFHGIDDDDYDDNDDNNNDYDDDYNDMNDDEYIEK